MNRFSNKTRRVVASLIRACVVATMIITPLMVVQSVRAANSQFIGVAQTMSNGAGLVLVVSLQRS